MADSDVRDIDTRDSEAGVVTTSTYIRSLRVIAGLSIDELAERAGVDPKWLDHFESGLDEEGINYDQLLQLSQATQPPRPEWWDDGYEHDLQLPPESVIDRSENSQYWERIEQVRSANRRTRG